MNKQFKTLERKPVDLISYCLSYVKEHPDVKIYVGTDSQNIGRNTRYATVVAFRHPHKGAHIIFREERIPRMDDMFMRLWKECEFTLDVAQWIENNTPLHVEVLELDYNHDKAWNSSKLVAATHGWCKSLGFKVHSKPDELIAVRAADHLCRA